MIIHHILQKFFVVAFSFFICNEIIAQEISFGGQRIVSPEISSDNRVTFRVRSANADTVAVTGSWMGWGERLLLKKDTAGIWTGTTTTALPSTMYHYNFVVDGVTAIDPANPQALRDGARYASLLMVPGAGAKPFQINDVPHGTMSEVWYASPTLELKRRMVVYTPPGYETSNEKYPVLYLLHGAGGDEEAWSTLGRTNIILDNLIAEGKAKPMLVVMTNGNATQSATFIEKRGETGDFRTLFEKYRGKFEASLAKDVVPFIEKTYRVKNEKSGRAIAGLSMGGMHTINTSIENPGMFDYIGVFSSGIFQPDNSLDAKFAALKNAGVTKYWVACGKEDFLMESNVRLLDMLKKTGIQYEYHESAGGHTWANWRDYLVLFAPMLFK